MNPRVLWRHVRMNLAMTLEYRGSFIIYMVSVVVRPVIALLVWLTVSDQGVVLPLDRQHLVTYYVLVGVVSMLTSTWGAEYLAETIRLGQLSPFLLRPSPYLLYQLGNNLGEKIVKLILLLPMVGVVALLFRDDLRLPSEPAAWTLFALSLPLAAVVAFLLDMLIGLLAFWVDDVTAISRIRTLVATFLSGQIVPLALFPPSLAGFLAIQPFRYTLSFPLEVLTGQLSTADLALGFAFQVGYCVVLAVLYRVVWRRGLRAYAAVGA